MEKHNVAMEKHNVATEKHKSFRLYDYNAYDGHNKSELQNNKLMNVQFNPYKDSKKFIIQAFGINEADKTASIIIENFYPFFYILVNEQWNEQRKNSFLAHLKKKVGTYYEDSIVSLKLVKRQKLYGFDNKKLHTFIKISFTNTGIYNKVKKLFYTDTTSKDSGFERTLNDEGFVYNDEQGTTNCYLYEADIPPLLKFFHNKEIVPSGWIKMPSHKVKKIANKTTHCAYEYCINYEDIVSYKEKETPVKYAICSFDIEASSSHGDFPLPIKNYKKLATNILENYYSCSDEFRSNYDISMLGQEVLSAFELTDHKLNYIAKVYPKEKNLAALNFENLIDNLANYIPANFKKKTGNDTIIELSESEEEDTDAEDEDAEAEDDDDASDLNNIEVTNAFKRKKRVKAYNKKNATLIELIKDSSCEYNTKLYELTEAFKNTGFPELEGDIITFIGMSFINYTEKQPYERVIIVKGGCKIPEKYESWAQENKVTVLERQTEKEVLLTFTKLIIKYNPHIITGYNITGFDFEFMYKRSLELNCAKEFLKLSRNKDEVCISKDWRTGCEDIENNKIILASGEYNLKFIKMAGRIIIDMYVVFRKEFTLSSNKLDFTSSYFISDNVTSIEVNNETNTTKINTKNLTGIAVGSYIKFDEQGFSSNLYKKGKKYEIIELNKTEQWFVINSAEELDLANYKYKWGLAKDDVTPHEIFALANGSDYDRWTVGKYCLADCDNVIWLLLKVDVITDKVEMSNLCNVPLSFLLLRGQGIKLQSYVSKKCGEKNTLMPVVKKQKNGGGYEGAHVFKPKTGIYLDEPVACVDYSSLYPSSIISENLSHDSKVWTKEYDLEHNLLCELGEKDEHGNFIYDNLYDLGYKYVDVKYDTYKYVRLTPKAAAKKIVIGYKICRFAQFSEGKAIMPSILEDLLYARKATRKLITLEKDEFMKNILDKRQLSIKVTANSLYGQMGAITSAFYEPDVAASTTAVGRKLLFYGRSIIEECYDDINVTLSNGTTVKVKAQCVYGDTDSVFFKFNLRNHETLEKIVNKEALVYTIELAKQAGELASKFLKAPHDLEYEKTFYPWILLSKKRYVGILYEDNPDKGKMKYMGIVLKRRDNAPLVKDIYGGIVNIIMNEKSISKSVKFLNECLGKLIGCEYPIEKLLVTKSLRGYYKNPKQIAHKVLAERIGLRDSGNKPSSGDRMYYAYIVNSNKKALQGEKIETPDFIKLNGLVLDYNHYISNQIMKPLLQLYALDLENMSEFKKKRGVTLQSWHNELAKLREKWTDPEKYEKKLEELKCKEIKSLLFDKYLKDCK
uniref:DNA-directed DNA polymerase n=1 Tax=viral metagenome TaxID=1070528 RepID=A0A6C0KR70_9ZZZZ